MTLPAAVFTPLLAPQDPKRLGTSSIDTTCTIWDIEKEVVDTQAREGLGQLW